MTGRSCSNPVWKPLRSVRFALRRKSGYHSPYTLGMVYPSYRKGLLHHGPKGDPVHPIMISLPLGKNRWFRIWPPLVRIPSWIARKARGCDAEGFKTS